MCVCGLPHGGGQTLSVRRCCRCPGAGPGVSLLPVPATIPRSGGSAAAAAGGVTEGTVPEHPREHQGGREPGRAHPGAPGTARGCLSLVRDSAGGAGRAGPPGAAAAPVRQRRPPGGAAPRCPFKAAQPRAHSSGRVTVPGSGGVTAPSLPLSLARCRAPCRAVGRARQQRRDINRR